MRSPYGRCLRDGRDLGVLGDQRAWRPGLRSFPEEPNCAATSRGYQPVPGIRPSQLSAITRLTEIRLPLLFPRC